MLWPLVCMGEGQQEYFLVPRKFNEVVESIQTKINNDISEYFCH